MVVRVLADPLSLHCAAGRVRLRILRAYTGSTHSIRPQCGLATIVAEPARWKGEYRSTPVGVITRDIHLHAQRPGHRLFHRSAGWTDWSALYPPLFVRGPTGWVSHRPGRRDRGRHLWLRCRLWSHGR